MICGGGEGGPLPILSDIISSKDYLDSITSNIIVCNARETVSKLAARAGLVPALEGDHKGRPYDVAPAYGGLLSALGHKFGDVFS